MVTQQELDELATRITDATTTIQDEVASLETQINEGKSGNELDLTNLKAAVGTLEGIEPPKVGTETKEAAPTNADGTVVEHTEHPIVAAARANLADAERAARQKAEDEARANV